MWMRVKSVTVKAVLIGALCIIGVLSFGLLKAQPDDEQDPPSVGDLIALLSSEDATVRRNAAIELGKLGEDAEAAIPALGDALADEDYEVRFHAVAALGEIGPASMEVADKLDELLSDESIAVRVAVLKVAERINPGGLSRAVGP